MTNYINLSTEQKLRATIHRDTHTLCTETCHLMGLDVSKSVTDIISELVYKKLRVYGQDLEAFAKHAKRNTVNIDDVKLLARRNPCLKERLNKAFPAPATNDRKSKTVAAPINKQQETPPIVSVELETGTVGNRAPPEENTDLFEEQNMSVDTIDLTFE